MSSSTGRSANPCNLWQGFADKQLVPKECATSTDSARESKALNPGLRLLKLLPGVWSRCKLPHEHKMRRLRTFKSHVRSLKERCSFRACTACIQPRVRCVWIQDMVPICSGQSCALLFCAVLGASESPVRKGNPKELRDSRGHCSVNGWHWWNPSSASGFSKGGGGGRGEVPRSKAIVRAWLRGQLGWNPLPVGNGCLQEQRAYAGVCSLCLFNSVEVISTFP